MSMPKVSYIITLLTIIAVLIPLCHYSGLTFSRIVLLKTALVGLAKGRIFNPQHTTDIVRNVDGDKYDIYDHRYVTGFVIPFFRFVYGIRWFFPILKKPVLESFHLGDVRSDCVWVRKDGINSCHSNLAMMDMVILFVHGGGMCIGDPLTTGDAFDHFLNVEPNQNVAVISLDYRLAPENTFPLGRNDVLSAYQALIKIMCPKKVVMMGESAGGNLVVSSLLHLYDQDPSLFHRAKPAAVVLVSPWMDLTDKIENDHSFKVNLPVDSFSLDLIRQYRDSYIGDRPHLLSHPEVSPRYASASPLQGFPPVMTVVGDSEIFYDQMKDFHTKLQQSRERSAFAGTRDVWLEGEGLTHIAVMFAKIYGHKCIEMQDAMKMFCLKAVFSGRVDAQCTAWDTGDTDAMDKLSMPFTLMAVSPRSWLVVTAIFVVLALVLVFLVPACVSRRVATPQKLCAGAVDKAA